MHAATRDDALAQSLAQSIAKAAEAGAWDVARSLTAELRALRHESADVVDLDHARRTRR